MGLHLPDVLLYVVRPTLRYLDPEIAHTEGAEQIVLGIGNHESAGYRYLDQAAPGPGPAFGLWQIEPATHHDIWSRFLEFRPALAHKLKSLRAPYPSAVEQLRTNMAYSCAMARAILYRSPISMPALHDIDAQASMAKIVFNSMIGKATVDDYRQALLKTEALFA